MQKRSPFEICREGIIAGLWGGASVMVIYLIADLRLAEPFHTPAVLQALLLEGPDRAHRAVAGLQESLSFTVIHFAAWTVAGVFASLMVSATDRFRGAWYGVVVGVTFAFCGLIWATGAWQIEGFDSNHLWVGAVLGSAAMAGYLVWKHPQLMDRRAPAEGL